MSDRISISGIILCGLIISGPGVLIDVTITQASAVWELYDLAPQAQRLGTACLGNADRPRPYRLYRVYDRIQRPDRACGSRKRDAPPSTWLLGSLDGPSIAERQLENLGLLSWLSIDAFQERSEEIL